jgi:hypothetical protein
MTSTPLAASERGPERRVHDLKVWPSHWADVNSGMKTVEIRKDDRLFRVGDLLILREWIRDGQSWMGDVDADGYTGQVCHRQITHVLRGGQFGLAEGYVALSLAEEPQPGHTPCRICGYARAMHGTGTAGVCAWFEDGQP